MFNRLRYYLAEMFPLSSFIGTLVTALAIQFVFLKLSGLSIKFHFSFIMSGLFTVSLSLLLRIMDEFKDYEDDKKNFPERPLPSGKVNSKDLIFLGWFCVACMLLSSLGNLKIFIASVLVLFYAYLMLKWFFVESKMRKSLPLALVSHHPIVFINIFYLLFVLSESIPGTDFSKVLYILPVPLIFTNWEFARKIRATQDETNYTTYSKIMGPRLAVFLCLILQLIIYLGVMNLLKLIQSWSIIPIVFSGLMLILSLSFMRFLWNPSYSVKLKKNAEGQILIVIFCLIWASLW